MNSGSTGLGFVFAAALLTISAPAWSQEFATVTGVVFDDANGNGEQDSGETGLANIVVVAIEEDTGAPMTVTTDAQGVYRLQAGVINHRVRVDESSLPFNGSLTTSRLEYNLNVPQGFVAPNINFGYQEVEPAVATGIVFNDANSNGIPDEGDSGFAGVTLNITHDETGVLTTIITGPGGSYRFEADGNIDHRIAVDTTTLPYNGQLTTGRDSYNLNVPPGFVAPTINFGYQEVEPAVATGVVFNDANGNGTQDEGEAGFGGVTLNVTHDETGVLTTLTTGPDGRYRFEANGSINHRIAVDTATLPFIGQLTTGRDAYNLHVPPGFVAPTINFGYQEVEPSAVSGVVFQDDNRNRMLDVNERGIPGVALQIEAMDRDPFTVSTEADGSYRVEMSETRFSLTVLQETLPYADPVLTTGRATYTLNIPNGFLAPNVNFGFRGADRDDEPAVERTVAEPEPPGKFEPSLPVIRPETPDEPPAEPPAPDQPEAIDQPEPITGLWRFYNAPFPIQCAGMGSITVTRSETCEARVTISADRQTLTGESGTCEGEGGSIFGPPGAAQSSTTHWRHQCEHGPDAGRHIPDDPRPRADGWERRDDLRFRFRQ